MKHKITVSQTHKVQSGLRFLVDESPEHMLGHLEHPLLVYLMYSSSRVDASTDYKSFYSAAHSGGNATKVVALVHERLKRQWNLLHISNVIIAIVKRPSLGNCISALAVEPRVQFPVRAP